MEPVFWYHSTDRMKKGLRHTETNMTQGTIWRHLLRFALPVMGGMLLQMLSSTDTEILHLPAR